MAASGNFATLNPLVKSGTNSFSNSNCRITSGSGGWGSPLTLAANTGKFYVEVYFAVSDTNGGRISVLPTNSDKFNDGDNSASGTGDYAVEWKYDGDSNFIANNGSSSQSSVGSWSQGDVAAVAIDLDASPKTVQFYKNNSTIGTAENINTSATGDFTVMIYAHNAGTWHINAGQDSTFGGAISAGGNADGNGFGDFKYSPPSGFLAMCTANLPIDSDIDPATTDSDFGIKNHNTIVYTGTASTQSITGLGFKPDLVWIQNYSSQNQTPRLIDSTRGVTKSLQPSYTTGEGTESGLTAFGTDGFTIGSTQGGYNTSTATYVAWCWRANGGTTSTNTSGTITSTVQANTAGGFSIVSYTGTGTNGTIGHGLTAAPEYMIIKNTGSTDNWINYNKVGGAANRGQINTGNYGTSTTSFQSTDPSATVITLGTSSGVNASTGNYIGYVWHGVEGYSKFDKYKGNGSSDGPLVYTGFRPTLLTMIRSTGGSYNVFDTGRYELNPIDAYMMWTTDSAQTTGYPIDFLANGFKIRTTGSGINQSGTVFYYAAWGDVPFKYNNTHP